MAGIETTGDKVALGTSPHMAPENNAQEGQVQSTGDTVALKFNPQGFVDGRFSGGQLQISGDEVALGQTEVKGLGSSVNLPFSQRQKGY